MLCTKLVGDVELVTEDLVEDLHVGVLESRLLELRRLSFWAIHISNLKVLDGRLASQVLPYASQRLCDGLLVNVA